MHLVLPLQPADQAQVTVVLSQPSLQSHILLLQTPHQGVLPLVLLESGHHELSNFIDIILVVKHGFYHHAVVATARWRSHHVLFLGCSLLDLVVEDALALLDASELREGAEDVEELVEADVGPVHVVDYLEDLVV